MMTNHDLQDGNGVICSSVLFSIRGLRIARLVTRCKDSSIDYMDVGQSTTVHATHIT